MAATSKHRCSSSIQISQSRWSSPLFMTPRPATIFLTTVDHHLRHRCQLPSHPLRAAQAPAIAHHHPPCTIIEIRRSSPPPHRCFTHAIAGPNRAATALLSPLLPNGHTAIAAISLLPPLRPSPMPKVDARVRCLPPKRCHLQLPCHRHCCRSKVIRRRVRHLHLCLHAHHCRPPWLPPPVLSSPPTTGYPSSSHYRTVVPLALFLLFTSLTARPPTSHSPHSRRPSSHHQSRVTIFLHPCPSPGSHLLSTIFTIPPKVPWPLPLFVFFPIPRSHHHSSMAAAPPRPASLLAEIMPEKPCPSLLQPSIINHAAFIHAITTIQCINLKADRGPS